MEKLYIGNAPAVIYGGAPDRVFVFVHGQCGCKEEAERFARVVEPLGYAVLGVDLPEHGGRRDGVRLVPWEAVPELREVMDYARQRWRRVSVRAISIGAWLALAALDGSTVDACLLSSPLLDMERMIGDMMTAADVSEAQLRLAGEITTQQGQVLSWRYLTWAREHVPHSVSRNTAILYATGDELIPRETVDCFAAREDCCLTLYEGGQHWLHTDEQLDLMRRWESEALRA